MDGNAYFSEVVIEGNKRTKLVYFQRILSDAGIGTTAPSNSQLYAFATKLKRNREPVPIDVLQNQTALALQILQESGLFDELDTKLELRNVRRDNVPEVSFTFLLSYFCSLNIIFMFRRQLLFRSERKAFLT